MTCEAIDALLEPLAAGDIVTTAEVRAHLDGCARCQGAYAAAVAIERMLAAQPAPVVREDFVQSVLARVRRDRWRSEQYLDFAFNLLLVATIVVAMGGLYALMSVSGLAAVSADLVRVFVRGALDLAAPAAPHLGIYVAAMLLVLSGLAVWWWAEEGLDF